MKFKLDENLPTQLVEDVSALGHDAETVVDEGLSGEPDGVILRAATTEGRALVTMDKGIADVRVYPPEKYRGIILLRPPTYNRRAVLAFARQHLQTLLTLPIYGHLLVVSERGIRVR